MSSGFPRGSAANNPPAMQETQELQVWCLGQEDALGEEMATHSSILAWKSPWTEEPGGLVYGVVKSQTWLSVRAHARAHTYTHTHRMSSSEGNSRRLPWSSGKDSTAPVQGESSAGCTSLIPGQGTKVPQAMRCSIKTKKKRKKREGGNSRLDNYGMKN